MRFQLWRRIGKRVPKNTCGVVDFVGYATLELESEAVLNEPVDEWSIATFHATDRIPIVPGDILFSSRAKNRYRIMSVEFSANEKYPWKVRARTLQQFERFAKHRDYQQCSSRSKKDENTST